MAGGSRAQSRRMIVAEVLPRSARRASVLPGAQLMWRPRGMNVSMMSLIAAGARSTSLAGLGLVSSRASSSTYVTSWMGMSLPPAAGAGPVRGAVLASRRRVSWRQPVRISVMPRAATETFSLERARAYAMLNTSEPSLQP
eukprot:2332335-Heterocapsa_arctica.AAC.1